MHKGGIMKTLITEIDNYMKYLIHTCNLHISLHPQFHDNVILDSKLRIYNIHQNSYCIFMKSIDGVQDACMRCQKKAYKKCKEGSFSGVCHAGVSEYVYPIYAKATIIGFISVSGYATPKASSYLQNLSNKYHIQYALLHENYATLNSRLPERTEIDTLIAPLQCMLELAYRKENSVIKPTDFHEEVLLYIKEHRTTDISSEDICKHFACSRSYLSHQFKKKCGMSIREYLNQLRIEDAKTLLINSKLNVTEISIAVGFNDSNYFSKIFKKLTGISPAQYRKEHS